MQRTESSASEESFWRMIELLSDRGRRRRSTVELSPPKLPTRKSSAISFSHPEVRKRLEKHMGTNVVRLTDKIYVTELEDRIREVIEETLNKKIAERVLAEMERLKRLILIGKTPLKDCPPELYPHPVFVFWRKVNKEVAAERKKRADQYYRKLQTMPKIEQPILEEEQAPEEEEAEVLTPDQLLNRSLEELEMQKQDEIEKGFRFTDAQYAQLKYEHQDIKTLKTLQTVEDLYALADKIIGTKRI